MVSRIEPLVLHIRFEGRSFDLPLSDLDIGVASDDAEVKRRASRLLERAGSEISRLRGRPA